jgi:hypothetical protein
VSVFVSVRDPSLTLTAKLAGAGVAAVGVPEIVPSAANPNPGGSDPLTIDHVCGAPLSDVSLVEYGTPTVPGASGEAVVTVNFPTMLIENGRCEGPLQENGSQGGQP